jgi:hypothetical protein
MNIASAFVGEFDTIASLAVPLTNVNMPQATSNYLVDALLTSTP